MPREKKREGMSEALCKRFPLGAVSFFVFLLQRAEEGKRSPSWMANWGHRGIFPKEHAKQITKAVQCVGNSLSAH
jgi:hypothetical protein